MSVSSPYGWIIGTGDYLYRWEETRLREGLDRLRAWNFGDTGHFMVMNNDGNLLLQPIAGRGVDRLKLGKVGHPPKTTSARTCPSWRGRAAGCSIIRRRTTARAGRTPVRPM
jgi:hypothetical protein